MHLSAEHSLTKTFACVTEPPVLEPTCWSTLKPEVTTERVSKHNSFNGILESNRGS